MNINNIKLINNNSTYGIEEFLSIVFLNIKKKKPIPFLVYGENKDSDKVIIQTLCSTYCTEYMDIVFRHYCLFIKRRKTYISKV